MAELVTIAENVVPLGLSFNDQMTTAKRGQKRKTVFKYPNQTGNITSNSNRTLKFLFDADGFLDTQNTYLTFDAIATRTSGSGTFAFNESTETWINQVRVVQNNGIELVNILNYDILGAIKRRYKNNTYKNSIGKCSLNEGMDSAERVTKSAILQNYVCELQGVPLLNSHNFLPLKAMAGTNSYSFYVEIIFNPVDTIGVKSVLGDVWTYTISNLKFVCDIIEDPAKEQEINNLIMSGSPLMCHYTTFRHSNNIIKGNTSGSVSLVITEFQESVKSIKSVFRLLSNVGLSTADNTAFMDGKIKTYYTQINNTYYPAQPVSIVNGVATQYYEYAKSNEKNKRCWNMGFNNISSTGGIPTAANTDFILDQNLKVFMSDSAGSPVYNDFFSGLNTKSNPATMNVILDRTNESTDTQMDNFVEFDVTLVILPNQTYTIS